MRELQTWMLGAIAAPFPPRPSDVAAHILPSSTLEPEERLELYRDMYEVRMVEALEGDYEGVEAFLGHAKFHRLAWDYIQTHPSTSYTLNRLGDHLPEFIENDPKTTRRALLADLARLELAMTEVFDEAEKAPLGAGAFAGVDPSQLAATRLVTIPALRLLALRYPVNELFTAFREQKALVAPRKRASWLVVHRRDYSVYRTPLTERAFVMLSALRDGKTIGESIELLPNLSGDELFGWFREWSAAGLFSDINVTE
jgi:hypothetical protein